MRCRRLKEDNNVRNVVWFGSYGINQDGTAKFYNEDNIHDNYADEQQGVADSLTQRLSIIQQELWYAIDYGLPLLEKNKTKAGIDTAVADIILSHEDVISIDSFSSEVVKHQYTAQITVQSVFGDINLTI